MQFYFIGYIKQFGVLCLVVFSLISTIHAQLNGVITNTNGEPLSYATIYIEGTTRGTTSNLDGIYSLRLEPGDHTLMFQYVGYESQSKNIKIEKGEDLNLDIQMAPESVRLKEVVVSADAEDPAYRVIREAIKKRTYYLNQIKSYKSKAYVKGLIKMFDAPEKFLGREIGNMEGILDTNRQGILYLSESESIVYYKHPNQYKEEMISSKVSGDDRGFSFNQATAVDFNFYKSTERFGRKLISPIAKSAFQFYTYQLIGVSLDQQGRLLNKIKVMPKRETDPVYFGYIYITEDLWNLQKVDLSFTSKSVNQTFFDTIGVKQVHVPVGGKDEWRLFSQVLGFNAKLFAFKFGGNFTYIFSEYEINPKLEEDVFSGEVMKVEEGANKRDSIYWADIRPIPLTQEESIDYVRKDSLQDIWESEEYLDSIDQKENKFKLMNLIFGYSYNQSFKHRYFEYRSPLSSFQFNPVQGSVISADLSFNQDYDEDTKFYKIISKLQYGFADNKLRPLLRFAWKPENRHNSFMQFAIGNEVRQISNKNPVWKNLNTWTSLLGKNNLLKLYDRKFVEIGYSREMWNGIQLSLKLNYQQRKPLENNTNYSFFKKDETYDANTPDHSFFAEQNISKQDAFIFESRVDFVFQQKYISYPNRRIRIGSKFPKLSVIYQKGLGGLTGDADFDKLRLQLFDQRVDMGRLGFLSFQLEGGWMINQKDLSFIDYFHFLGNELHVTGLRNHDQGFLKLPNYAYSTSDSYGSLIVEQHFEGLFMDRVPLLKHWSWETVFGIRYLYQKRDKRYLEFSVGFDQIAIGPVSLFRFDYVWGLENGNLANHGPVFSLSRVFGEALE